jgi:hypothetical protein
MLVDSKEALICHPCLALRVSCVSGPLVRKVLAFVHGVHALWQIQWHDGHRLKQLGDLYLGSTDKHMSVI